MADDNYMALQSALYERNDGQGINFANYMALEPNGDEIITFTTNGVKGLNPPNEGSIFATVSPFCYCLVRFGADPDFDQNIGTPHGDPFNLTSKEQIENCRISMHIAPHKIFVQYWK